MKYKEPNLTEVLRETFGQSYIDLVDNDKKKNDESILSMKLDCIKAIMRSRIAMGTVPTSEIFDNLYDKSLYDLQSLQVEFLDMQYHYERSLKSEQK